MGNLDRKDRTALVDLIQLRFIPLSKGIGTLKIYLTPEMDLTNYCCEKADKDGTH